jgi:hypothetical protein
LMAVVAAFLGSASGKITIGFLPPSSRLTRLRPRGRFLSNVAAGRYRTDKANAVHIRMDE